MIALLLLGLAAAVATRTLIGGASIATSSLAAIAFSVLALATVAVAQSTLMRAAGVAPRTPRRAASTAVVPPAAARPWVSAATGPAQRASRVTRDATIGVIGAAVLLAAWLSAGAPLPLRAAQHLTALAWWTPVVLLVAVSEEIVLRGALFSALQRARGTLAALVVTSIVFALMHVPMYGVQAVPLDVTVGLFLGGLRMLTGGVIAPSVAHALTDVAAGWLG